jgi:transposase
MNAIHYIGFDVHKKTISFCVKTADGQIVEEGRLQAERTELRRWAEGQNEPGMAPWKLRSSVPGYTTR